MDEAYTDTGTVIPPDTFAITLSRDGECRLLMPTMGDDDEVPAAWLAGTMVAIKFMRDPEWVKGLTDEFGEARNS